MNARCKMVDVLITVKTQKLHINVFVHTDICYLMINATVNQVSFFIPTSQPASSGALFKPYLALVRKEIQIYKIGGF